MIVLTGSSALVELGYDRVPNDIDLIGHYDDLVSYLRSAGCKYIVPTEKGNKLVGKNGTTIFDCEVVWDEKSLGDLVLQNVKSDSNHLLIVKRDGHDLHVPSLNILYALKMEHRFKKNSPHFYKTMRDIRWMRDQGASITPELRKMFKQREKAVLAYNHPKLNVEKGDFFNGDGVDYVYDHDTIHLAVKLFDQPAYTFFKPEDSEVLCSKPMFFEQPREIQLAAVYEEACVLALERSQIPHPKSDRYRSFEFALGKVCTSITSGWFREFSWENYEEVISMYKHQTENGQNYLEKFKEGIESGIVKEYH